MKKKEVAKAKETNEEKARRIFNSKLEKIIYKTFDEMFRVNENLKNEIWHIKKGNKFITSGEMSNNSVLFLNRDGDNEKYICSIQGWNLDDEYEEYWNVYKEDSLGYGEWRSAHYEEYLEIYVTEKYEEVLFSLYH